MTLFLLSGPTAVGKTALSIEWAIANNAEILSCDSTLFYKGMDIGTAKPTSEEMAMVSHHGIDLVDVSEQFDIGRYIDYAKHVIQDLHHRGKKVLITGGSGFYLKAFFEPVIDDISVSEDIASSVEALYAKSGLNALLIELRKFNPDGLGDLDVLNHRRVMKALGRCMATGQSYMNLKNQFNEKKGAFDQYTKNFTLLIRDDANLKLRIRQRAQILIDSGLIEEVKTLLTQGILLNPSAATAIGYRETIEFIQSGESNTNILLEKLVLNTNRLVAKQRKWFRNQSHPDRIINLDNSPISLEEIF